MEQQEVQADSPTASSSTISNKGSPSTLATSPTLSPPKSPELEYQQSLSPPTIGESPLPPLPAEVYLSILSFLPTSCLPRLLLVSKAWKSCIENEPQLWPNLVVHLDFDQMLRNEFIGKRSSVNKGRFGGGIKDLRISTSSQRTQTSYYDDCIDYRYQLQRLEHVYKVLNKSCVPVASKDESTVLQIKPSTLDSVLLYLPPNTIGSVWILHCLFLRSIEPCFDNLKSLEIQIRVPNITFTDNFFSVWPQLRTMKIWCPPNSEYLDDFENLPLAIPKDRYGQPLSVQSLNHLETIDWTGTRIFRDLQLPFLPSLTTLKLSNVVWEGKSFFLLLRIVRRTLISLECHEFTFLEEDQEEEWGDFEKFINVKDPDLVDDHHFPETQSLNSDYEDLPQPAPIILPALQFLSLTSEGTPPLFASLENYDIAGDSTPLPTPVFHMPNLEKVVFTDINLETEDYIDDSETPLAVFGRNALNVSSLTINSTGASSNSIFYCIAGMSAKLVELDLDNSFASDILLAQLPGLLPKLETLDVRRCSDVTIQGVARLVEVVRDLREGKHRIKSVYVDPPEWGDAEYSAYLWLDFVGVLTRNDWDHEGTGPTNNKEYLNWKRQGKKDIIVVERLAREAAAKKEQQLKAAQLEKLQREYGFTTTALANPNPSKIATTNRTATTTSPYFNAPAIKSSASSDSTLSTISSESNTQTNPTTNNGGVQLLASVALQHQQLQLQQQVHQQQQTQQQQLTQQQQQIQHHQRLQVEEYQYHQQQQIHKQQLELLRAQNQPHSQTQTQTPPQIPTADPRIRRAEAPSPVESNQVNDIEFNEKDDIDGEGEEDYESDDEEGFADDPIEP